MTKLLRRVAVYAAVWATALVGSVSAAQAGLYRTVLANGDIMLPGMVLTPPANWRLHQDAISNDTLILGFANGDDYVTMYVKQATGLSMRSIFLNDVKQENYVQAQQQGPFTWQNLLTSKTARRPEGTRTLYMNSFLGVWKGYTYYGYSRSQSKETAVQTIQSFLEGMRVPLRGTYSLTGPDYTGKKYYIGFGDRLSGFMGNEVKYDIRHTHDIFTKQWGGNYIGDTLLGMGHDGITAAWKKVKDQMGPNDMYVQYSSGHGSTTGLMAGVSYREIRDNALAMPAKEIIIFTMACYSGNLVESFNARKSDWENWGDKGRTLMVMASSQPDEESNTGPGTDEDEPNGPYGSAGSAFGHALWKSLIGYADGTVDGVKDGYLSLGEIKEYTGALTRKLTGNSQNPVVTGVFNTGLIMNQVPSKAYLASLVGQSTEGMSDEQVSALIEKLDRELAVQ